ncbi:MAG: 30S ribosomal protein S4 [Candidatus Nealsonbacteria bacterium]
MIKDAKCKICRRQGVKLFLKGERCLSPKCAIIKKPYPPGQKGKRRKSSFSEYGKELREKQKLRNWYNLSEKQFRKYVREILNRRSQVEDAAALLIQVLESRFDNIVYRLGFASSRIQARQLITHGHFLINGKPVNIPSYFVKKGEKIGINSNSLKNKNFASILTTIKKYKPLPWLSLDAEKLEGETLRVPTLEEVMPPAEISSIFEFYSR